MPPGASPTSIISPTATRRWRGCWCARSFRASRPAARWTTWCWRRSTTRGSTISGSRSASGSTQPVSMSATPGTRSQVGYVRDGTLRRVEAQPCGAGLLPHRHPAHHAGIAGSAARGARQERQDADRLHQRAGAQLAARSSTSRSARSRRRCRFTIRCRWISRSAWAATAHPRDPTEPMLLHLVHVPGAPNQGLDARAQFRIGQGKLYAMTLRRLRGAHPRRPRPHARPRRLFQRARHRGDHRQPLAARLQLCRELAV